MFAVPRILDSAMPRLGFVNAMMIIMMMMMKLPIVVCAEKLESETTKV